MPIPAYEPNNIFTKILAGEMPCHKIYEDDKTFAFLDIMPRSKGHCLVIPRANARNLLDAALDDVSAVMATVQKISQAALGALDAQGITILQANEPAANQVVFHLHFHIMPRYDGERMAPAASKMGEPEELAQIAVKLRAAL
jgi:histidine triad (HIT) family protein